MTRFGEIPPLWQIFKICGNLFEVNLALGKVFNSLWHNLYDFGQIFIAENGQILKTQSGHLVTLATTPKNHLTGKKFKAQLSHHFTTTTTEEVLVRNKS